MTTAIAEALAKTTQNQAWTATARESRSRMQTAKTTFANKTPIKVSRMKKVLCITRLPKLKKRCPESEPPPPLLSSSEDHRVRGEPALLFNQAFSARAGLPATPPGISKGLYTVATDGTGAGRTENENRWPLAEPAASKFALGDALACC